MIADEVRESLYQELRQSSALWAKAGSRRLQHTLGKKRDDELTHRWRQDFADLKDQLMSQLLLLLHTLFDFSADDQVVRSTALKSLAHLFEKEEACIKEGFYDAQDYALYLFRRYWHEATKDSDHKVASASGISASEPKDTLLTGIDHLERASFFRKTPQRIATWTQWFLLIRHYHRFDTQERENRRARYRFLRSMREQGVSLLLSLEDLIVWLAFRLEEASIETVESGSLSRNVSRELDGLISPDVLQDEPLQPIVYVFLKCH